MSYVVIARRWRPQQFNEIIGQEHVSRTLSNAISNQRIAHAYIFTGPRGVGKTTTARILSKAVNCEKGPTATPCNECASCKAITNGNSMDVLEIDGASNRGIDEIRNLREKIRFTPSLGRYRIYIIDEVHMLTKEAFNALLKTLEEPPAHALFIFATTEIHRVPPTILSRCQRFDFRRIPLNVIMEHLRYICQTDGIEIEEEAMLQIAKKADGSMRDAQSILDQIISFSGETVTFEEVAQALGVIHQDIYFELTESVKEGNIKDLVLKAREIFTSGYDLNEFLLGLEEHFRNLLITNTMQSTDLIDSSDNYLERYRQLAPKFAENDLMAYLQIIAETAGQIRYSRQPQLKFELGLIKLAKMPATVDLTSLLEKVEVLKKKAPDNGLNTSYQNSEPVAVSEAAHEPSAPGLQEVKQCWPSVVQKVQQKNYSVSHLLENAVLQKLEGSTLHLVLKSSNQFLPDRVNKKIKWIEHILNLEIGGNFKLKVQYEQSGGETANHRKASNDQRARLEKLRKEDGLVDRLIKELELDLI